MRGFVRCACAALMVGCAGVSGCGEAETAPPPPKVEAPPPAPAPEVRHKGKKKADPRDDMSIKELREYNRQQRGGGETP